MKNIKKLFLVSVLGLLLMSGCGSEDTSLPISLDASGKLTPTNPKVQNVKDSRIVGGYTVASASTYPWMAGLIYKSSTNNYDGQFCGGALIADNWVITAAHCVNNKYASDITVLLNTNVLDRDDDSFSNGNGELVNVKRIIVHPNYNSKTYESDIALIELKRSVSYSKISLNRSNYSLVGKNATAIGWGYTNPDYYSPSEMLRYVNLPIVSNKKCRQVYGDPITNSMICAGYNNLYKDTGSGDSGGPLIVYQNGRWELAGLTSYGATEGTSYGVYTKVSSFRNFISKYVQNNNNYNQNNNNYNYNQNNNYNNYNQTSSLQVFDFYQRNSSGVYKASCYKNDWIIDGEFKLKNSGNKDIYVDKLALAVHHADGSFFFDLAYWDIPSNQERLNPNGYYSLYKKSGWIMTPGSYKLIAKAYYNNSWHNLQTKNFVVQKNYSCSYNNNNYNNATIKNADYYIDKFHDAYPNFFGYRQGSKYTCYTDYRCQKFTTGNWIAVHKNTYAMSWKDNNGWHYHGIGPEKY